MEIEYPTIRWSFIYIGLKYDWLTSKEAVNLINANSAKLNCTESFIVEINVHDDEKDFILEKIKEKESINESEGITLWQLFYLMKIKVSDKTIKEKLVEIESQWARFDYPEEWRDFIYYLPSEYSNSPEDVYLDFINYILRKKKELKY